MQIPTREQLLENCQRFVSPSFFINEEGKIDHPNVLSIDTPWYHVRTTEGMKCFLGHQVIFGMLGQMPQICMDCYKVVIKPRHLAEVHACIPVMRDKLDYPCKIGGERRLYASGMWGGYFYNTGLEAGRKCYQDVKRAFVEAGLGHVPVILKRGCTEYEVRWGDSLHWHVSEDQKVLQEAIGQMFARREAVDIPEFHDKHVMREWVRWAAKHGDSTWLRFSSEAKEDLFVRYRFYHEPE